MQHDLIGRPMSTMLPTGAVHDHTQHFRDFGRSGVLPPAISGAMREVNLRCADSCLIPAQLTITTATVAGEHLVVSSIVDLRPVKLLQRVC